MTLDAAEARARHPGAPARESRRRRSQEVFGSLPAATPPSSASAPPSCTARSRRRPTTPPSRRSRSTLRRRARPRPTTRAPWPSAPFRPSRAGSAKADGSARAVERSAARRDECFAAIDALVQRAGRRRQDAHPRRLPSRPGADRAERRDDRRFRGRAVAAGRGAAGQELAAARRRRHAALLRLRGRDGGPRRRDALRRKAAVAAAATATIGGAWLAERAFLMAYEEAARGSPVWIDDAATRRAPAAPAPPSARPSTRSTTRPTTGPTGSKLRCRGVLSILDEGSRP